MESQKQIEFIAFLSYKLKIKTRLFRMNLFMCTQSVTVTSLIYTA